MKSPPELWSELSDPDALARHLGALGEIRITRTEPESLVEWETDGASGRVQIKPSGWGTKVTLSVSRELSVPSPPRADDSAVDGGDGPADEPGLEPQTQPVADAPETAVEAPSPEPGAEEPGAEEPEPEPIAEEPEPEAIAEEPGADCGVYELPDAEPQLDAGPAAMPEPLDAEEPEELVPRRGFFARLFGRRRRERVEQAAGEADFAEADEAQEPVEPELPAEYEQRWAGASLEEHAAGEAEELVTDSAPEDSGSPAGEPAPPGSAIDALQARFTALAPEPDEQLDAPEPEPEPKQEHEPWPESDFEGADAAELAETAPSDGGAPAPPAAQGLAGELAAAEGVAAEEVKAVLVAVLDRLGSAHHRPFSRS